MAAVQGLPIIGKLVGPVTLDKLLADIKDSKDLVSFGRKYPDHLDAVKSDLKQARQLLYGVVKKLNFPE